MGPLVVTWEGSASGQRGLSRSWTLCTELGARLAPPSKGGTCPSLRWPIPTFCFAEERGHQEGDQGPCEEDRARRGEDQSSQEHPLHAAAEPLCCSAEEEC